MSYLYPSSLSNDPQRWLDRASELRALAGDIHDHEIMTILLKLANDFDRLAESVREIPKCSASSDKPTYSKSP